VKLISENRKRDAKLKRIKSNSIVKYRRFILINVEQYVLINLNMNIVERKLRLDSFISI